MLAHPSVEVLGHRTDVPRADARERCAGAAEHRGGLRARVQRGARERLRPGRLRRVRRASASDGVNGLVHSVGDVDALAAPLDRPARRTARCSQRLRDGCLRTAPDYTWTRAGRAPASRSTRRSCADRRVGAGPGPRDAGGASSVQRSPPSDACAARAWRSARSSRSSSPSGASTRSASRRPASSAPARDRRRRDARAVRRAAARSSPTADGRTDDSDVYAKRATLYGNLIASPPVRERIAQADRRTRRPLDTRVAAHVPA